MLHGHHVYLPNQLPIFSFGVYRQHVRLILPIITRALLRGYLYLISYSLLLLGYSAAVSLENA